MMMPHTPSRIVIEQEKDNYAQDRTISDLFYSQMNDNYPIDQFDPLPLLEKSLSIKPTELFSEIYIPVPFGLKRDFNDQPCHTVSCTVAHAKIDYDPKNCKMVNEDSFFPREHEDMGQGIWAIFDGVSSQNGIASHIGSKLFGKFVKATPFNHFVGEYCSTHNLETDIYNKPERQTQLSILGKLYLETALRFVNQSLVVMGNSLQTTVVACLLANREMIFVNAGDSLAYLCDTQNPQDMVVINKPATEFNTEFLACFIDNTAYTQIEQLFFQVLYTNQPKSKQQEFCQEIIYKLTFENKYRIQNLFQNKKMADKFAQLKRKFESKSLQDKADNLSIIQKLIAQIPQEINASTLLTLIEIGKKFFGHILVDYLNTKDSELHLECAVVPFTNPNKFVVICSDGFENCGPAVGFPNFATTRPSDIPIRFSQNTYQKLVRDVQKSKTRSPDTKLDDIVATCIQPLPTIDDGAPVIHQAKLLYPNMVINPNV